MRTLQPPLTTIQRNLFQPSDALILRWTQGETLPPGVAESLAANAQARARRADLAQARTEPGDFDPHRPAPSLPPALRAQIQRRVAARNATFAPMPQAGQIVRIDAVPGSKQELPRPLAVLLAEPTATPQVWSGWLVATETDYAAERDLLLGPEDEPCDPLARMVQTWNPVRVDLPSVSCVLAQLSTERLDAVRALAAEPALSTKTTTAPAVASRIHTRQAGPHHILTGAPLGGEDDPRRAYQRLYADAARTFLEPPAGRALNRLEQLLVSLRNWAAACTIPLVPLTPLAQPMGEAPADLEEAHYQLGDSVRLHLRLDENRHLVRVRVESSTTAVLRIEWREAGETLLKAILGPDHPSVDLAIDPQRDSELHLADSAGQTLWRMPLGRRDG